MEEKRYVKDDVVIQQEDIGDSTKTNTRDSDEVPKELARLGPNAHFGELALLSAEPRSATVTVVSETALLLQMKKEKFDEIMASCNNLLLETRIKLGREVVSKVPLFQSLTAMNKRKLLETMEPVHFPAGSYICKQGTFGNTFYVLTEGTCKVTLNKEDGGERDILTLRLGDYFGEVALIDSNQKRTANVISLTSVTCMSLSRSDFEQYLWSIKSVLMQQSAMRQMVAGSRRARKEQKQHAKQNKRRRISGFDENNFPAENLIDGLLKRFMRFATESLWCSLYFRLWREMVIRKTRVDEFGETATLIVQSCHKRAEGVSMLRFRTCEVLQMDPGRRSVNDHKLIIGLLRQRNALKDRLCKSWLSYQYSDLCRRVRFLSVAPMRKIFDMDVRGSTAFLILRGSVRIFGSSNASGVSGDIRNVRYEEDLMSGEVFGEAALEGATNRTCTALAITSCDLCVIDAEDFIAIQEGGSKKASVEDRYKFLSLFSLFKHWEPYRLIRVAQVLQQEEYAKHAVIIKRGDTSKKVVFIRSGRVDLVDSSDGRGTVLTYVERLEYIGESGLVTAHCAGRTNAVHKELCSFVASCKVEVFSLSEEHYLVLDANTTAKVAAIYLEKSMWRKERSRFLNQLAEKQSREKQKVLRKQKKIQMEEAMLTSQQLAILRLRRKDFSGKQRDPNMMSSSTDLGGRWIEGAIDDHVPDLEDIPFLVDCASDPVMILNTCRNEKDSRRVNGFLKDMHRPRSARSRKGSGCSAFDLMEPAFSSSFGSLESVLDHNPSIIASIPNTGRSGNGLAAGLLSGRSDVSLSTLGNYAAVRRRLLLPVLPGAYLGSALEDNGSVNAAPHTPRVSLHGSTRIPAVKSYYEMLSASDAMVDVVAQRAALFKTKKIMKRESMIDLTDLSRELSAIVSNTYGSRSSMNNVTAFN
eukprot:gene55-55_t